MNDDILFYSSPVKRGVKFVYNKELFKFLCENMLKPAHPSTSLRVTSGAGSC